MEINYFRDESTRVTWEDTHTDIQKVIFNWFQALKINCLFSFPYQKDMHTCKLPNNAFMKLKILIEI